jgi:MoxR-like ATPase
VERQLPDPFLRRCVFYHIRFPGSDALRDILRDRFGEDRLHEKVVRVFERLRDVPKLTKKPATSELLDWAGALRDVLDRRAGEAVVDRFLAAPGDAPEDLPWAALPALACLLKLREDFERVRAA